MLQIVRNIAIFGIFVLITATTPRHAVAQEAVTLAPGFIQAGSIFVREGDNIRLDVGGEVTVRCDLFDQDGNEVATLPSGDSLSTADPALQLRRGPPGGVDGQLGSRSATINLTVAGLYVFECVAGNPQALDGIETPVRVAVARPASIGSTEVTLTDPETGRQVDQVEVGQDFDITLRAFSSQSPERLIRPSNSQVLFRQGDVDCGSDGTLANQQFNIGPPREWSPETGLVRAYTALRPGRYTVIVNQLDGQGTSECDAVPITVLEDLFPPEITLRFPGNTHQLIWREDLLRVSGRVVDSGSGVASVRVSNGHWSEDARLFDTEREGEMSFFSDLPFARGLQILTIVATDESGREARLMESVYVGEWFSDIRTADSSDTSFDAVRQIALRPGRSLVHNQRPGIDSLSELAQLTPELLSLLQSGNFIEPVSVDEEIDQSFLEDVRDLIKPDFKARGAIIPGRLDVSVLPGSEETAFGGTFNLRVGIPLTGSILMRCDGVTLGLERTLCAIGGAPSGEFDVEISGRVVATLPMQITSTGGLTVYVLPKALEVRDALSVSNGLGNNGEINSSFRQEILEEVRTTVDALLWELPNCPSDPNERTECQPRARDSDDATSCESPFVVFPGAGPAGRPDLIGIELNGGETLLPVDLSLPSVFDPRELPATAGILFETLRIANGRLETVLTANLRLHDARRPDGIFGALLDWGSTAPGQARFPTLPDLDPIFGSGSHDVQALIHRNALNEAIAQYWATGALDYRANLFQVLDDAGFFPSATRGIAQAALANAYLDIRFQSPPRLTYYDGARGLFAELGDARISIDLRDDFESMLEFEAALITRVEVGTTGSDLEITLSDPTGCAPSSVVFMSCDGRFEIGLRGVDGFRADGPRPNVLESDLLYNAFLDAFGIRTASGQRADDAQIEAFYEEALGGAIATFVAQPLSFDIPPIPLPEFEFGRLNLGPLRFTEISLHPDRNGGRRSEGWFGVELNIRSN